MVLFFIQSILIAAFYRFVACQYVILLSNKFYQTKYIKIMFKQFKSDNFLCIEALDKHGILLELSPNITFQEIKDQLFKTLLLSYFSNLNNLNIVNVDLIFQYSTQNENGLDYFYHFLNKNYSFNLPEKINVEELKKLLNNNVAGNLEFSEKIIQQAKNKDNINFSDLLRVLGYKTPNFNTISEIIFNYCKLYNLNPQEQQLWLNSHSSFVTKTIWDYYKKMKEAQKNKEGYFHIATDLIDFQKSHFDVFFKGYNKDLFCRIGLEGEKLTLTPLRISFLETNNLQLLTIRDLDAFYFDKFIKNESFVNEEDQKLLLSLFNSFTCKDKVEDSNHFYFDLNLLNKSNPLLKVLPIIDNLNTVYNVLPESDEGFLINVKPSIELYLSNEGFVTTDGDKPKGLERENLILKPLFELLRRESIKNSNNKSFITALLIWFTFKNKGFRLFTQLSERNILMKENSYLEHTLKKLSFKEFIRVYTLLLGKISNEESTNILFNKHSTINDFLNNFRSFSQPKNEIIAKKQHFELLKTEEIKSLAVENLYHFLILQLNKKMEFENYIYYLNHEVNLKNYKGKNLYFEHLLFNNHNSIYINESTQIGNVLDKLIQNIKHLNIVEDKRHINLATTNEEQVLLQKYYNRLITQEMLKDFYFWHLVLDNITAELDLLNLSFDNIETQLHKIETTYQDLNYLKINMDKANLSFNDKYKLIKEFFNKQNINQYFIELFSWTLRSHNQKTHITLTELPFYSKEIFGNLSYLLKTLANIDKLKYNTTAKTINPLINENKNALTDMLSRLLDNERDNPLFSLSKDLFNFEKIEIIKNIFNHKDIYTFADLETLYSAKLFLLREYKNYQFETYKHNHEDYYKSQSYIKMLRNSVYVEVVNLLLNNISYEIKERLIKLNEALKGKFFVINQNIKNVRFKYFEHKYPFYQKFYHTGNSEENQPIDFVLTNHIFDNQCEKQMNFKSFSNKNLFGVDLTTKNSVYEDIKIAFILDLKQLLGINDSIDNFDKINELGICDFEDLNDVFIDSTKDIFVVLDRNSYSYQYYIDKIGYFERRNQEILKQNLILMEENEKLKSLNEQLRVKLQKQNVNEPAINKETAGIIKNISLLTQDIKLSKELLHQRYSSPYQKFIIGDKNSRLNEWFKILFDLTKVN